MLSLIPCHSSDWSDAKVAPSVHKPDTALCIPRKKENSMRFLQLKTLKKQKNIFLVEVKLGRSQSTVSKLKAFGSWGFRDGLEAWFPISLKWASWVPASPRGCFETSLRDHGPASISQQGGQATDQAALGEDQIMSTPLLQVGDVSGLEVQVYQDGEGMYHDTWPDGVPAWRGVSPSG